MNQENCAICMEKLNGDIRIIPCGHKFHTACYGEWESRSTSSTSTCPCCRAETAVPEYNGSSHNTNSFPNFRRRYVEPDNNNRDMFVEELFRSMHSGFGLEEVIRMRMQPEQVNVPVTRDLSPQEVFVSSILLLILVGIVYCFTTVHSTCMCNVKWKPGETSRTEQFFFGGESTYNRPELCTWVC